MKDSFIHALFVVLFVVTSNWVTDALNRPPPDVQAVQATNGQTKLYLPARSTGPGSMGIAARD